MVDFQDDVFLPVAYFTVARLRMCVAIQKGLKKKHFDFDNAIPNGYIDREMYDEFRVYANKKVSTRRQIARLKGSLYLLKDAA